MKRIRNFNDFSRIYESLELDRETKNSQVKSKIRRTLIWLSINKGFYAELLSNISISGSYSLNPPTMCTNGSEIMFHPDFVLNQSDEAVRLVLAHEILHCLGGHCDPSRMGPRDPQLWNIACDFAINPILKTESGFKFPIGEDGNDMGLYDPKYDGWRPEDIYEELEKTMSPGLIKDLSAKAAMGSVSEDDEEIPGKVDADLDDITGTRESGEGDRKEEDGKEGDGKEGDADDKPDEGKDAEKGNSKKNNANVKVGDRIRAKDGTIGIVKKVNPDGSILI
jgi:hypothetical protein